MEATFLWLGSLCTEHMLLEVICTPSTLNWVKLDKVKRGYYIFLVYYTNIKSLMEATF